MQFLYNHLIPKQCEEKKKINQSTFCMSSGSAKKLKAVISDGEHEEGDFPHASQDQGKAQHPQQVQEGSVDVPTMLPHPVPGT